MLCHVDQKSGSSHTSRRELSPQVCRVYVVSRRAATQKFLAAHQQSYWAAALAKSVQSGQHVSKLTSEA